MQRDVVLFVISPDHSGAPVDQQVDHLVRVRSEPDHVAGHDDVADAQLVQLGQDGPQGGQIPVDVGQDGHGVGWREIQALHGSMLPCARPSKLR